MTTTTSGSGSDQYAMLHRLVENGDTTEATWQSLGRVCIELDKKDEALQVFARITSPVLRRDLHHRLQRRGWVTEPLADAVTNVTVTEADLTPSTREKFQDAVELLLDGKMRRAVLTGTLAFPVVLGLGGMMCAASDGLPMRLLALAPALFVIGMVVAFGRHVLLQAMRAIDDASTLPELRSLVREVPDAVRDVAGLSAPFLLPGSVLLFFDQTLLGLLLLLPAMFLMPMATALRLACRDWRALTPKLLLAAARGTKSYFGSAGMLALTFLPALLALAASVDKPLFLIVSMIGPLAVAPFFVAMRMLGLTLHYEGKGLPAEFVLPGHTKAEGPAASPPQPRRRSTKPASTVTRGLAKPASTVTPGHAKPESTVTRSLAKPTSTVTPGHAKPESTVTRGLAKPASTMTPGHAKPESTVTRGLAKPTSTVTPGHAKPESTVTRSLAKPTSTVTPGHAKPESTVTRSLAKPTSTMTPGHAKPESTVTRSLAKPTSTMTPGHAKPASTVTPGHAKPASTVTPGHAKPASTVTRGLAKQ